MACARPLVVCKIAVRSTEFLAHRAGFGDRHVVIGLTMQYVDAQPIGVWKQQIRVTRIGCGAEQSVDAVIVGIPLRPTIGPETRPAGTWRNGGEVSGAGQAEVPCAMAAHGVSSEPCPRRVIRIPTPRIGENLKGIEASPFLPVKAEWASIGGRDNHAPVAGFVAGGLLATFDRSAVQGQHGSREFVGITDSRNQSVVLHTAVDIALEGVLPPLVGIPNAKRERIGVEQVAAAASKAKDHVDGLTLGNRRLQSNRNFEE